jgi:cellulose synthase/poly-beta-1,6-N-acetylglucosamine synthase-like glycosyltransferase
MDADNTVEADFLTEINKICHTSQVLQLHRTQKEISTKVAQWDGISEEVNNNIFRKGHVNLKISSALIGSGMVFDYTLFNETIKQCNTFAEDKELEVILASRGIFIDYVNNIKVYDEKTAKEHIFMRQRTRWTHAQIIAFSLIMQRLKWENLNLYFIDKLIQWIPYPRQIRISIALLFLTLNLFLYPAAAIKWIILIGVKILTILLAIPRRKYNKQFLLGLLKLPQLILLLIKSIFKSITRIIKKDNSFMSTPHSNKNKLS